MKKGSGGKFGVRGKYRKYDIKKPRQKGYKRGMYKKTRDRLILKKEVGVETPNL